MSHKAKLVATLRLTYVFHNGAKATRTFQKARLAAEFYALMSSQDWWLQRGHLDTDLIRRKVKLGAREALTYRRVLPIFQRALP